MVEVGAKDYRQVPAAQDQQVVEALAAEGAYPTFGEGVGVGRLHRGPDDPGTDGAPYRIEGSGELGVAVADEEPDRQGAAARGDEEVAGLLGNPPAGGVGGDAGQVHRKRVVAPPVPEPGLGPRLVPRPAAVRHKPVTGESLRERLERITRPPVADDDDDRALPSVDDTILDVDALPGGLRLELHPALGRAGDLAVVAVDREGAELYRGRVQRPLLTPSKQPVILEAKLVGQLPRPPKDSELAQALADAKPGTILLLTGDLRSLVGRWRPLVIDVDEPIDVRVLQSGDARRALIIPVSGTAAAALPAGRHRLTLKLSRKRWETTDAADALNTYAREGTLPLQL